MSLQSLLDMLTCSSGLQQTSEFSRTRTSRLQKFTSVSQNSHSAETCTSDHWNFLSPLQLLKSILAKAAQHKHGEAIAPPCLIVTRQMQQHHNVSEIRSSSSMQDKGATWGKIFSAWDSTKIQQAISFTAWSRTLSFTGGGWGREGKLPGSAAVSHSWDNILCSILGVAFSCGYAAALTMVTAYAQHHPHYMVKKNWTAV